LIMLVLRSLWLERNGRIFRNQERSMGQVSDMIVSTWQSWLHSRRLGGRVGDI
jgi:hypothetical protein